MPNQAESASNRPHIILVTGNMASGKSSVAQALAERVPVSVHLRGDLFRRAIVNGQAKMTSHLSATAMSQLRLRYRLSAQAAKGYVEAGFTVVYQDVVIGKLLSDVVASFDAYSLFTVVLCPRADVIAHRDRERAKRGYADRASVDAFDRILRDETPRIGYWLDNSDLTVEETVDRILEEIERRGSR